MKKIIKLVVSIVVCQLAGVIGSIFTVSNINTWYIDLSKPLLNPPNWVFGPVWITLYFLMGIALFLVWNKGLDSRFSKNAFILFIVQLVFNAMWSIVFFGLHQLLISVFVIIILWLLIFVNIVQFGKISKPAAYLLLPYILWVSFASYLNIAIYILNA
ncbi:MAG TPA: tryptophan-rich sensory protein [Ignavibacteria bacterium]|nr:TspO protein [Bacteroidota bacterium]HRE11612.1 tryptophan-rich sensory protein [Ignavibacteria bacterium]HRF67006.1 tryptophan-rich sensory protein [Ignavibacteria bacterium]